MWTRSRFDSAVTLVQYQITFINADHVHGRTSAAFAGWVNCACCAQWRMSTSDQFDVNNIQGQSYLISA